MNQEKIGKFILELRKEKHMTQQELADKLGVTDRAISKWENGRGMPDLSLMKPLCDELEITINELISAEKIDTKDYPKKSDENIINTIDYTNKKIEKKNNMLGLIVIIFGILIAITAVSIFPSESSWGSIYSVFGIIVSLIGVSRFTRRLTYGKRVVCNFGYFLLCLIVLLTIDYIGVVNIHQAPRFSFVKVSGENVMYYDTPFYDVVRCNVKKENEVFKVMKNQNYEKDHIDRFCNQEK